MALTDHVAILTYANLVTAQKNKQSGRMEFYALLAFPPSAQNDLAAMFTAAANGAPLSNFKLGVKANKAQEKPIPGVDGDWLIVRAASAFAPYLADAQGARLDQAEAINTLAINSTFYAGKKVRASLSAWQWTFQGKSGMSVNLLGLMDAGSESERLNIGNNAGADFAKYAQTGAASASGGNPFETKVAGLAPQESGGAQGGNPFAQAAKPDGTNPFM